MATFTITRAIVNDTTAGDFTLAAAATGTIHRLIAWKIGGGASGSITFKSATTAKSANMTWGSNATIGGEALHCGWVETVAGEALVATIATSTSFDGLFIIQSEAP